jgi:glycine cleavage system H protein
MIIADDLKYTKTHEWVKVEGTKCYVGLTDYAQIHLGQIVFVDLPEVGDEFSAGDQFAEVESVKAVSEVYSPVTGTIEEINEELLDNPALLNEDAYANWLVIIEMTEAAETDRLMSPSEYPDIVIGCAGGGSNLAGLIAPYMQDKLTGKANPRIIAVEPASCPTLTRGKYAYDFCDVGRITPMAKMYTLGSDFKPSPNHAGGLRYHGMSPILSKLYHDGFMEAVSVEQTKVFEAATLFAKVETILPAPESAHAIRAAIDEALKCKESGEVKTIVFGLTGTGYFDMSAYTSYIEGTMTDYVPTDEDLQRSFSTLPKVPEVL